MERLIVQIEQTDGFTYSCEDHIPVVFSSKEEFLITLEDTVNKIQKDMKELNKLLESKHEKLQKLRFQVEKTNKEKAKNTLFEELREVMNETSELNSKISDIRNFNLGGQTFNFSQFVSRDYGAYLGHGDQKEYINLPQVWTIDEYFAEVEKDLISKKPKI